MAAGGSAAARTIATVKADRGDALLRDEWRLPCGKRARPKH